MLYKNTFIYMCECVCVCIYIYNFIERIYYKESAHAIMEADKSQDLLETQES